MLVIENKYIVQNNSKKAYFIYLCTNINNTTRTRTYGKIASKTNTVQKAPTNDEGLPPSHIVRSYIAIGIVFSGMKKMALWCPHDVLFDWIGVSNK